MNNNCSATSHKVRDYNTPITDKTRQDQRFFLNAFPNVPLFIEMSFNQLSAFDPET